MWPGIPEDSIFSFLSKSSDALWLDSSGTAVEWSYIGLNTPAIVNGDDIFSHFVQNHRPFCKKSLPIPMQGGWFIQLNYPSRRKTYKSTSFILPSSLTAFLYELFLAYSHGTKQWFVVIQNFSPRSYRHRRARIYRIFEYLRGINIVLEEIGIPPLRRIADEHGGTTYMKSVHNAKAYISRGDIYQVNVARKFNAAWSSAPCTLYHRMRKISPPQHGAYLGPGLSPRGEALCCISPELFLRVRNGHVTTQPIKGTRPRGANPAESEVMRRELESSSKERAELNMIVDLERNDLGRVCRYNSVKVVSPGEIHELPTLFHRAATIEGEIRTGVTVGELLNATFPGGSITGAPKIRAMEIIDELEAHPRGAYCGAIGWLGFDGDMELNIAIRTAVCDTRRGRAHYFAGAGIVADSDPEKENAEVLLKAQPFFRAVNGEI
jgi:para-aminobenzoate synthetase component 1